MDENDTLQAMLQNTEVDARNRLETVYEFSNFCITLTEVRNGRKHHCGRKAN